MDDPSATSMSWSAAGTSPARKTRFGPEQLKATVTLGEGQSISAREFLERMAGHTSRHAGQLVPASRARRG